MCVCVCVCVLKWGKLSKECTKPPGNRSFVMARSLIQFCGLWVTSQNILGTTRAFS